MSTCDRQGELVNKLQEEHIKLESMLNDALEEKVRTQRGNIFRFLAENPAGPVRWSLLLTTSSWVCM